MATEAKKPRKPNFSERSGEYGKRYVDFQDTLRDAISLLFIRHVKPSSVLHIIPSISEKVLTQADVQYITCLYNNRGEIVASQVLLERLSLYENWFHCVIKLLEHDHVKLNHIAKLMKDIYEQVFDKFYSQPSLSVDQTQNQATGRMTKQHGPSRQELQPNDGDGKCQENWESTITFLFNHHVNLELFLRTLSYVSGDQKINSDKDMVEKIAKVSGDDTAKKVLVDCIAAHKNWFSCMVKVFNHQNMNLKPLADIVQMIHDKQGSKGTQTQENPLSAAGYQFQVENDIWKPRQTGKEDPLSTMTLNPITVLKPEATTMTQKDKSTASFQYRLKSAISDTFAAYVDMRKFLYIIPQINTEVLTVVNVLEIQAIARTNGNISAAYHLLDSIVRYKDWFSLLLQVLRHAEMKLSHVADQLQVIQGETIKKFQDKKENSASPKEAATSGAKDMGKASEYDVNVLKSERVEEEGNTSLAFQQKLKSAIAHHFVHHVRPMSVLYVFSLIDGNVLSLADMERIKAAELYQGETRAAFQMLDCLFVYKDWFPCLLKVLRHKDVKLHHVATKFEEIYNEITEDRGVTSDKRSHLLEEEMYAAAETQKEEKSSTSVPKTEQVKKPRLENDFTHYETSKAMKRLPGWHEQILEHMVEARLQKLTTSDGNYILWYWERRKRPAISVTYKNKIKTFVVHKQIGLNNKPTMFYIDRNGIHDADLLNLIEYHIHKGLPDLTNREDRILFLEPVPSLD